MYMKSRLREVIGPIPVGMSYDNVTTPMALIITKWIKVNVEERHSLSMGLAMERCSIMQHAK